MGVYVASSLPIETLSKWSRQSGGETMNKLQFYLYLFTINKQSKPVLNYAARTWTIRHSDVPSLSALLLDSAKSAENLS